ncbi:MAG: 23S rRNA methyltransferase [Legionellales bacterium RIFCSPHIGHO2_12_FULL_37_14]|nr:MAG: 23S rRNA methyltransferase [Legionellales bacterium RIFCSPHIGHO2_12_FULL_37_14]
MARLSSSKKWLKAHKNDLFVKQSKLEGYKSRAVYKLKEIDEKAKLIKPGMTILELGAAPGGWTQYITEKLNGEGQVIAVDCLKMDSFPLVTFIQGDFTDPDVQTNIEKSLAGKKCDLLLSDMAPNLSGVKMMDSLKSIALAEAVLEIGLSYLKQNANLFMKIFHGTGFDEFVLAMRKEFKTVSIRKPKASKTQSRETYLLALERIIY